MTKIGIRVDNIKADEFKASYEATRSEILARVRIRTQILGFFVAASGTLAGILINNPTIEFILVMSFFSFAAALMVAHQDVSIAIAANHCKVNIKPSFGKGALWNNCSPDKGEARVKRWLRFISQSAIISFPILFSFLYLLGEIYDGCWDIMLSEWSVISAMIFLLIALIILFATTCYREKKYSDSGD